MNYLESKTDIIKWSQFFNERAARRSRSTSRGGCLFVYLFTWMSQLAQEQLQSAITMASVNRIDSNFFL